MVALGVHGGRGNRLTSPFANKHQLRRSPGGFFLVAKKLVPWDAIVGHDCQTFAPNAAMSWS
jgi:hypothetical protein